MLSVGQDWAVEHARWRATGAAAVARQRRAAEVEGVGSGGCAEGGVGSAAGAAPGGVERRGGMGWGGQGRGRPGGGSGRDCPVQPQRSSGPQGSPPTPWPSLGRA